MKRLLTVLSLLVISITGFSAMTQAKPSYTPVGTDISKLWKDYEAANAADRPQKQMDILSQIKDIASKERLPWDFYKAGELYVQAGSSRNWKLRDSLDAEFHRSVKEFDEPVMSFYDGRDRSEGKFEFITAEKARLEKGHNRGFYENDGNVNSEVFSPALLPLVENDWQYALWSLALRGSWDDSKDVRDSREALKECLSGKYPAAQMLEFFLIAENRDSFRKKEYLESFVQKYSGKAVSLLARQELLNMEWNTLTRENAGQDSYKALRAKCDQFEKDRRSFAGSESGICECCENVKSLIGELDGKNISFSVNDGVLEVLLRNLPGADVTVSKGAGKVLSFHLDNPSGSYYVLDTLKYTLPDINDGEYTVLCRNGKIEESSEYRKYSLSFSVRPDADGWALFLANSVSGEPVKKADISISDSQDKKLAELKDFALDGFTRLPATFMSKMSKNKSNYLSCSYIDSKGIERKTNRCSVWAYGSKEMETRDNVYGAIFVDRTAFNPEETVHFKAIAYHGDNRKSLHTLEQGKKLTVNLIDAQGKQISSKSFITGEFGSIAGDFLLERRERNGRYSLILMDGNRQLNSASLRVDDFVLPTFDLKFVPVENIFFPGDRIKVSGQIKSYSGHSLGAADIRYRISLNGETLQEDVLKPESDGRFDIVFKADGKEDWLYYNINVRVTDATGETLEWNTERTANKNIPIRASLENASEARYDFERQRDYSQGYSFLQGVSSDDVFIIKLNGLGRKSLKIGYTLKQGDKTITEGSAIPGDRLELNTAEYPSGHFVFEAKASDKDVYGNAIEATIIYDIIKVKDGDNALNADVNHLFKAVKGDDIAVQLGNTDGAVWACVEIFGTGDKLLGAKMVHLDGVKGQKGSLLTVSFEWLASWPDLVSLHVIYFKDNRQFSFEHSFDRTQKKLELPLSFTRFQDRTAPGTDYSFEIGTRAGVECAATVFDKSTETINSNIWSRIFLTGDNAPYIRYSTCTGCNESQGFIVFANSSSRLGGIMRSVGMKARVSDMEVMAVNEEMAYDAAPMPTPMAIDETKGYGAIEEEDVPVRENFANTIAFEPFLKSDGNGKISFNFTTADKLSTYFVQLFAHDKDMDNAVLRREMVVTIPVKVSVTEPQFLYAGDRYILKAALSSSVDEKVCGRLKVDFFDGDDYKNSAPILSCSKNVSLDGFASLSEQFPISVPDIRELGIKVTFISDDSSQGSDAVFVCVPVSAAEQTLTEAHSSILHTGESIDSLLATLKSQFVNIPGDNAEIKDISLLELIREAIPGKVEPESDNVLDLSEALYVRLLAARLGSDIEFGTSSKDILNKIIGCSNADGGFGWFEGMESSPVITAVLLQRYASLRDRGLIGNANENIVAAAVKYLDKVYFSEKSRPEWCGGISREQYISTRTKFASVEFDTPGFDRQAVKDFKKDMKEYLVPSKERGLDGYILGKARRMRALMDLSGSEEGLSLAKSWGVKLATGKKLTASLCRDLDSIEEYAITHQSGGCYYPNAVMPYRGLLESEAYAHAFIADILRDCVKTLDGYRNTQRSSKIADGIRLWLMVQKETQHWEEDAAFVDALSTVLDGSEDILGTRIISLSKTFTKPFGEVKAAGNGMSIERKFYLEKTDKSDQLSRTELKHGDELKAGDKIIAEYRIWNEENRSFVKITAPRTASMKPVNQISGHIGWWLRSMTVAGWRQFSPQGYRSVLKDRSEYWFDIYPEENTTITEEFFVSQSGEFQAPAIEIESLYAPHYRANDAGSVPMVIR